MKKRTGRMVIPLAKPYLNRKEERAVYKVIRSGWLAQGPKVAELEKIICEYTGAKYAIATSSATTALFLCLHLLGIGPGDEVIVPSFSFIASANIIMHVGAKPIFADIDPNSYNIDYKSIEKLITKDTKGVIPVDQVGLPCDLDKIKSIAKKHNLFIVEDSACALGSSYKNRKIGSISDITCFSFHARKIITTGEGGMILTNNKNWAEKARILRHHGMSVSDFARHKTKKIIFEKYNYIGYNFRMSDLEAAVGVEQMKKLPKILKKRTYLAERYTKSFKKNKLIIPPYVTPGCIPNWQSYIVRLKKNNKVSRDQLMQKLLSFGISTRRGVMAAHKEPCYINLLGNISLPITEFSLAETISIPIYYEMTNKEQDYVIEKINEFTKN